LPAGRRSVAAAARSVLCDIRNAGWLLFWLGSSRAPAALRAAAQFQLETAARWPSQGLYVLVIDSTQHGQQGQNRPTPFARGNTQQRPQKSDRKQKPVQRRSCHCFVFALLLTPSGVRIPYWLPFYTKEFGVLCARQHLSQTLSQAAIVVVDSLSRSCSGVNLS